MSWACLSPNTISLDEWLDGKRPDNLKSQDVTSSWFVYILLCGDNSLYTGITNDVLKRLDKHQKGKGAKYTRGRGPLELVYVKEMVNKSSALKEEYRIKQLSKKKKLELIDGDIGGY